ncbi:DUF218 domain [Mycobacteroides abscessus subsp. abscessus]|nr:DUF218 domain [Mycobacteroides abscessus subsp. abscessus]
MELNNFEIETNRLNKYKTKRYKRRNILVIWIFLIIAIFIIGLNAGKFLVVNENPRKSEAIIILSGAKGRLEKGIELYKEGYGDYLILTNSDSFTEKEMRLLNNNVPKQKIIYEDKADSTYANATLTLHIMEDLNFNSAIVVTSDYHTSRSRYIFNKVYKDKDLELTYAAATSAFNAKYWWKDEKSRYFVRSEYKKWLGYLILY